VVLQELPSVQVVLNVIKALLEEDAVLAEVDFYTFPRLHDRTRLFKLPFCHIYALTRDQQEYASPNQYRTRLLVAIDFADQIGNPDSQDRRIHVYEERVENIIIRNLQIPNHLSLLPTDLTWEQMNFLGSDYDIDEQVDERVIDESILQVEVFYYRTVV
jgi:hypothetical protein